MFLIEKVPKESTETRDEPLSKSNIYICSKEKKKCLEKNSLPFFFYS